MYTSSFSTKLSIQGHVVYVFISIEPPSWQRIQISYNCFCFSRISVSFNRSEFNKRLASCGFFYAVLKYSSLRYRRFLMLIIEWSKYLLLVVYRLRSIHCLSRLSWPYVVVLLNI